MPELVWLPRLVFRRLELRRADCRRLPALRHRLEPRRADCRRLLALRHRLELRRAGFRQLLALRHRLADCHQLPVSRRLRHRIRVPACTCLLQFSEACFRRV